MGPRKNSKPMKIDADEKSSSPPQTELMDDIDQLAAHFGVPPTAHLFTQARTTKQNITPSTSSDSAPDDDLQLEASTDGKFNLSDEEIKALLSDDEQQDAATQEARQLATAAAQRRTARPDTPMITPRRQQPPISDELLDYDDEMTSPQAATPPAQEAATTERGQIGPGSIEQSPAHTTAPDNTPHTQLVESVKIRYVQHPKGQVENFSTCTFIALRPPQHPREIIGKLRDDSRAIAEEAYCLYLDRTTETKARALHTMHTEGLLDPETIVLTTMFESKDENIDIPASAARMDTNEVYSHPVGHTNTTQLRATVHYSGNFQFPNNMDRDNLMHKAKLLRKARMELSSSTTRALDRYLNNKPPITPRENPKFMQRARPQQRKTYTHTQVEQNGPAPLMELNQASPAHHYHQCQAEPHRHHGHPYQPMANRRRLHDDDRA